MSIILSSSSNCDYDDIYLSSEIVRKKIDECKHKTEKAKSDACEGGIGGRA
ncbi:hypothetical protein K2173_008110 [Erythroxylum novogranatense]|uniref:Uncharacterized protein n=1 Tax=Erythroxylum novogranatense TaxID=1862640 RepID=A0AAV8S9E6_9ROSI|nr:hypothetical protein K2173_008110 [Erythroxylum novogranatense]